jgi:hypothetical protein
VFWQGVYKEVEAVHIELCTILFIAHRIPTQATMLEFNENYSDFLCSPSTSKSSPQ